MFLYNKRLYYSMQKKTNIPQEIIEEIELKEPKEVSKEVKVIYSKHTNQFSIKIPSSISRKLKLKPTDRFEVTVAEDKNILLKKVS